MAEEIRENEEYKNKKYRWKYNHCGGRLKLTDEGIIRCLYCGTKGNFIDWSFNCGNHYYKLSSVRGVAHALGVMAQLATGESEQKFVAKTARIIISQFLEKTSAGVTKVDFVNTFPGEVTEIDFISPCPFEECIHINKMYRWLHDQCRGPSIDHDDNSIDKSVKDEGKNLYGVDNEGNLFQNKEEPPTEPKKDKEEDNEEHQHIDVLVEETLDYLMELKKKSNKINAFVSKSKELMIAMHDYIISQHIYWYHNDLDEHENKVEEILNVCKDLQKKGYPSNLFFFIRNMLNPNTQNKR